MVDQVRDLEMGVGGVEYTRLPQNAARASIRAYVERGIPVGAFLRAVLANNLVDAAQQADEQNSAALAAWGEWVFWDAPAECWGSPADVAAWCRQGGLLKIRAAGNLTVWGGLVMLSMAEEVRLGFDRTGARTYRTVVAAKTKKRAQELLDAAGHPMSRNYFNGYWSETRNAAELTVATEEGIWLAKDQGVRTAVSYRRMK